MIRSAIPATDQINLEMRCNLSDVVQKDFRASTMRGANYYG